MDIGHTILEAERIVLLLLLIALVVSIVAKRFRMPYTVGLVLIGLALTPFQAKVEISPELILGLLVPPLLFEAAFHIRIDDLRRDLWLIMLLAIPGVIVTTLLVAGAIHWGTGIALSTTLIFGALIAATDPVAVVALFKQLGVPKRLQILLEGESLFNDGTAIVMFGLMLEIAISGNFSLTQSLIDFVTVAGGGVLVGLVLGLLASQIIGRIDDALVETTITTTLAFGAYLIGEEIGVSGVLAVVVAGIVNGNIGPRGMSPTTRIVVNNFWEYAAFLANSLIFLLIGLTTDFQSLLDNWQAIGVAIIATLGARAVGIYGFSHFGKDIPTKWKHILYWGGLRGAIVLALALSIPTSFVDRERLLAMAFGVVLFTLLVQGFSMDALVNRMQLINRTKIQERYERRHARFVANRAAADHLEKMSKQGLLSAHIWQQMQPIFTKREIILIEALKEILAANPAVEIEELDAARREALRVQRASLGGLFRDGVISEETYGDLIREVDEALTEQHVNWSQLLQVGTGKKVEIKKMMAVIIQDEDLQNALRALSNAGFGVDQLPSTGGFLSQRNVTLLIAIPEGREEDIVRVLKRSCNKRVEHVRAPLEGAFLPISRPVPVDVGGATIFTFDVEAYHEF
ncbi:MAG: Na+/H+ antiporter [Anaerolineae bacterium]|jgi:monovalent cation:H+ antiporter, CPA1 family|nr:Na+/H+ antiporter [Anaerolineae bacterium]MBT7070971.1 Na+/H+ antiporter [Anaerolineae bacterium]MBT7325877.1 Na+/H+ antiporter [Anaerolineae bacterium]